MARRSTEFGCLGILIFGAVILSGIVALLQGMAEVFQQNQGVITVCVVIASAIGLAVFINNSIRSGHQRKYLLALQSASEECSLVIAQESELRALRHKVAPLPVALLAEEEIIYRGLVHKIVSDCKLTEVEQNALLAYERILALSNEKKQQVRRAGFLRAVEVAIADGILTEDEDQGLSRMREALQIDGAQVRELVALQEQLRRAREVSMESPRPRATDIKLRGKEQCYWQGQATEQVERQGRGRQRIGGGIHDVREGTLYLTSERLLFVGGGTLSIPLQSICDIEVSEDRSAIILVSQKRQSPYRYKVLEPYVLRAMLERVSSLGESGVHHISAI